MWRNKVRTRFLWAFSGDRRLQTLGAFSLIFWNPAVNRLRTWRNGQDHGVDRNNICNRGQGVQLELSQPLRDSFFASLDRRGPRGKRTQRGDRFVDAMRNAILGGNAGAASKADKIYDI
jgi:hypothetical protein